ncbi:transporter [Polaribacter cellanae]|uniref:Transporter n=1 Tax=Polaribacter cellanae TaxID=2818493 RepID=A0A975CTF4_9FLAO|nr:transporter [Polaribacter cellanae]QTE23036.1 transporter [Polaribacter cellanae]
MKKVVFIAILAIASLGKMNAQNGVLNAGVNVGLPTGDASDASSFTLGAEVNYMFTVADGFTAGPSVSYSNFFGKKVAGTKVPNVSFLPVAGAARYNVAEDFVAGVDLGYAIGINPKNNDGGFYYRPMLGYKIADNTQLNVSYSGVSRDGGSISNVSVGIMFGI